MNSKIKELTLIALFPALMGATAGVSIPLFNLPPITMQTFFVFLSGWILGPKKGALSMFVYLIIGVIGIPVFSGFRGGFDVLIGYSGGFLIGFIFATFFVGIMKLRNILNSNFINNFIILVCANLIIYVFGGIYITILTRSSLPLVLIGFSPYLVGDFIKIATVIYVYQRIRNTVTYELA